MNRILKIVVLLFFYAGANAQLNVAFRSNLPFPNGTGGLSNIGGYVDSLGNEYALVGWGSGLTIVDVTDPVNPVVKQSIGGIYSTWREVKTWTHYAYVTTEGCCDGLQIIDLGNLPGTVTSKYWKGTGGIANSLQTIHALHIDNNGTLYLHGSNLFNGATLMVSLNDPWNPVYLGHLPATSYVHDGYAYNDTLYSCHIYDGYVGIWNVTNKSNPILLATQTTPNAFPHNSWLNDQHTVMFTTDEVSDSYVTAYDITNLSNIVELDRVQVTPGSLSIVHNTHTLNNYEVVSWYKDGIAIIDVSRPDNMIVTGWYDTYAQGSGSGFDGCWGVYPFLPSGNLVVSDMSNGLYVLTPTYVRGCYLEGTITDSITGTPINNVDVEILGQNTTTISKLSGIYKTGLATAGTYTVKFSKTGYYVKTATAILNNGVLTPLDIQLKPIIPVTQTGSVTDNLGLPIANAEIRFYGPWVANAAVSDSNGLFSLPSFIPDVYTISCGKWGYISECLYSNLTGSPLNIVLQKGYYDDFSLDFNWTFSGTSVNLWERCIPVATYNGTSIANPDADANGDCMDYAMVTDNGGGGPFEHDVDWGDAALHSPSIDATIYSDPYLHYSRWYYNGGYANGAPDDTMKIFLSNGLSTVLVESVTPSSPDSSQWVDRSFQISNLLPLTSNMHFIIQVSDSAPVANLVEGGLDRFYITEGPSGISESTDLVSISVWPNPFEDQFKLRFDLKDELPAQVIISDAMGRMVAHYLIKDRNEWIVAGENWPSGIYFLTLATSKRTESLRLSKIR